MSGDAIPISLPQEALHINSGKELLGRFQEWLKERFLAGDSVVELVAARSHFIDELLCKLWEQYGLAREPTLSLVAVGGYGRGELHPIRISTY